MSIAEARIRHDKAMEEGRQARRNTKKRDACPYRLGTSTDQRDAWLAGWEQADMHIKSKGRK